MNLAGHHAIELLSTSLHLFKKCLQEVSSGSVFKKCFQEVLDRSCKGAQRCAANSCETTREQLATYVQPQKSIAVSLSASP